MGTIVLNPKDKKEFKFIRDLLSKLGIDAKVISDEEMEDLGMSILMKDLNKEDLVPKVRCHEKTSELVVFEFHKKFLKDLDKRLLFLTEVLNSTDKPLCKQ